MIEIKDIGVQNVFDVCELTTNQNGIGTRAKNSAAYFFEQPNILIGCP